MSKRSFTLLVIPDTPHLKAVQLDMSYLMFWLIVLVFFGSFGGIGYLLYDFHNSDQSNNIIARNLERRQQMSILNQELTVLERRMLHLITSSTEEPIPVPDSNENLMTYQMRLERLRSQAELFTPILLKRVDAVHESMERSKAIPTRWPVEGILTSPYGYRASPTTGKWTFHKGIDIAAKRGTSIVSPKKGVVVVAEYQSGYGNYIEIDHGYGIRTRYGHASKLLKRVGSNIQEGEAIALVGSTGRSTGPHLHYEIRIDGVSVDPQKHLEEVEP